jgi:TPR repeat protein
MEVLRINRQECAGVGMPPDAFVAYCLSAAQKGDLGAYFDLGVALSTGGEGLFLDLVEAHKWFNIAATLGHPGSARCRADLAREMSSRHIAEAQRLAREWLAGAPRKAA